MNFLVLFSTLTFLVHAEGLGQRRYQTIPLVKGFSNHFGFGELYRTTWTIGFVRRNHQKVLQKEAGLTIVKLNGRIHFF